MTQRNKLCRLLALLSSYHARIEPFGHGPGGDDIVHDPFRQRPRHLVQFHKLPHVVEHLVVFGRRRCHLLDDGRHVTEDGRVQQSCVIIQIKKTNKTQKSLKMILRH